MVNLGDYSVTSIETITAYDTASGDFKWILDELQNFTLAQSEETSNAKGKGGRRLNTLKRNKSISLNGANGYISTGLLETQTGGTTVNGLTTVHWRDYLVVNRAEAKTTWKAFGTTGAEIKSAYIRNADGTIGKKLTQAATVQREDSFTYDPATQTMAFNAGMEDGTSVVVQYMRQIKAPRLDNYSDTFAGKASLFVDVLVEDKCHNLYRGQFYIPTVDFSGEFSLEFGSDQSVHNFSAEALANSCLVSSTGKSLLWTYTIFGMEEEDAA